MAIVVTRPVGMLGCNMSIIADPSSLDAVLVDPGGDAEDIIRLISEGRFKIVQILITHAHFDHILACNELEKFTGAPIYFHGGDRKLWLSLPLQCMFVGLSNPPHIKVPKNLLNDRDSLAILGGRAFHTPGHTEGSTCFYFESAKILCSGDTLFAGSIGRTDLPGGSTEAIMKSIKEVILTLPDDTRVITGHGEETTVGRERSTNPFLAGL